MARIVTAVALAACAAPAAAAELSWSGFGTLGWAQSNRDWTYERNVDDEGSADRDSLLGLQLDARLSAQWSATLQLKAAQALDRDRAWAVTPTWAFVGWRPSDDWLLRAGRMRVPFYLYSELLDVGAVQDMARLPSEIYAMAPSNDFDGLAATKTWSAGGGELSLDAYAGRASTTARLWSRDGLPGVAPAGAQFLDLDVRVVGAALAWRDADATWRASLHRARTRSEAPIPVRPRRVDWLDGSHFYALSGPGVEHVDTIGNLILTLGVERRFGDDWRVVAEFARNLQRDTDLGSNTTGSSVALFRRVGGVTPYVAWSRLRATDGSLRWFRRLSEERLAADPAGMPPGSAALINAAQRYAAESSIYGADQRTLALGASWTPAPGRQLKLEWQRSRIGAMSRLVDTPAGAPTTIRDTTVDVWSLQYAFVF